MKFLVHVTCGADNPSKAESAMPNVLVRLAAEADRVLCY